MATDVQSAGDRVVALANVGPEPADLYELRPGKEPRRVTREGARWFGPFRRQVETVSLFDRRKGSVEAWMLRGGRGRRPTVLHVHGGPYASHAPVPWLEMLALAGAGFHVVWANPSGSTSYGQAFTKDLDGRWGVPDSRQWLRLVDGLAAQGIVHRDRIGLLGLSYGGFETLWMAGHHPDRFRAVVSENPVADLIAEFGCRRLRRRDLLGCPHRPGTVARSRRRLPRRLAFRADHAIPGRAPAAAGRTGLPLSSREQRVGLRPSKGERAARADGSLPRGEPLDGRGRPAGPPAGPSRADRGLVPRRAVGECPSL